MKSLHCSAYRDSYLIFRRDNLVPVMRSHNLDLAVSHVLVETADDSFTEGSCVGYRHQHNDEVYGEYRCNWCKQVGVDSWMRYNYVTCLKLHVLTRQVAQD